MGGLAGDAERPGDLAGLKNWRLVEQRVDVTFSIAHKLIVTFSV
jgi:hypothetical protein